MREEERGEERTRGASWANEREAPNGILESSGRWMEHPLLLGEMDGREHFGFFYATSLLSSSLSSLLSLAPLTQTISPYAAAPAREAAAS